MNGNERLLIPFAIYGLVGGIVIVIGNIWYDPGIGSIAMAVNIPTVLTFFWILGENFAIPVPIPIWNVIVILWSTALWTVIGFIIYRVYRLLVYIPP